VDTTREGEDSLYSIGRLAEATGLAPDTIRVWERRYGRPVPVRLPSGHRRYDAATVSWMRRVAEALAHGHRPHKVVPLSDEDLARLLQEVGGTTGDGMVAEILELAHSADRARLEERLGAERARRSPLGFVTDVAAPVAHAIGRSWAEGEIDIRHEHLFAEVLENELRALRHALPVGSERAVLLTTLSGERHGLGLQMAAVAAQVAGARPIVLGVETPDDEIPRAAIEHGVAWVGLSVSLATGGASNDRRIAKLRDELPEGIGLIVGGAGARGIRRGPRGVEFIGDLGEFAERIAGS